MIANARQGEALPTVPRTEIQRGLKAVLPMILSFVPFGLLLSRTRKRQPMKIAGVALLLCVMRYVDIYWWITPAFSPNGFWFHPLHLTTVAGIGGVWLWRYIGTLSSYPIVAVNDPVVSAELEHA